MSRRLGPLLLFALGAFAAACGGGDGGGDGQPSGDVSLTDPGTVPSSTPISTAQVFLIRENGVSAPTGATATPSGGGGGGGTGSGAGNYTVVSGDTCGSIASAHGISTADLYAANPTINDGCTNLQPGQVLAIPGGGGDSTGGGGTGATPATPTPSGGGGTYIVESGDTCFDIAANQGISVPELMAANSNIDCSALQPGDVIQIP